MSVLVKVTPPGVPLDVYDKVNAVITSGDPPAGQILHAVYAADGSFEIIEIWESAQHCDDFVENRLKPAIRQVVGDERFEQMPDAEREVIELHNLMLR